MPALYYINDATALTAKITKIVAIIPMATLNRVSCFSMGYYSIKY
jgi:hypothetical protein